MNVLLIGGLGYIGSHVAVSLASRGQDVYIVDNLENSKESTYERIKYCLTQYESTHIKKWYHHDIRKFNPRYLNGTKIDVVIHLAGLKSVGESTKDPMHYYSNNLELLLATLTLMESIGTKKIIFSSTAAVYGNGGEGLLESTPINCLNPYSSSKFIQEEMLKQFSTYKGIEYTILRYFNPIGNDPSGMIGEEPNGIPNNLLPYIMGSASGQYGPVSIFGDDYPTIDGTGVRDYINVCDLADAHALVAMKEFENEIYNVGYGVGTSVKQMIDLVQEVTYVPIKSVISPRRNGDIAICTANSDKFKSKYNWDVNDPISRIRDAIESQWKWEEYRIDE